MKSTVISILAIALLISDACAQSLTITDGTTKRVPLHVDRAHLKVSVIGDAALTTLTLRFRNHTNRMQEGEFLMPLPSGATVSDYTLEVNGKLRESVAVEKERARHAYETIKRQMIDPGLVEREAGNVYRTRVFPIPANGTKELRIGYVEHLHRNKENATHSYTLPLNFPEPVDEFTADIFHHSEGKLDISAPDSIHFQKQSPSHFQSTTKNARIEGSLNIRSPAHPTGQGFVDSGSWFYASGTFPDDLPPAKRPHPEKIRLLWDASTSAAKSDHKKLFQLLDTYLRELETVEISLTLLRFEPTHAGDFKIKNGDWRTLRKRLENVYYDGSNNFEPALSPAPKNTTTILVTDGNAPRRDWALPDAAGRLFIINTGTSDLPSSAKSLAKNSGGQAIDLNSEPLQQLTTEAPKIRFQNPKPVNAEIDFDSENGTFRIFGQQKATPPKSITVHCSIGDQTREIKIQIKSTGNLDGFIPRLWAQQRLATMESSAQSSRTEIIDFATKHKLVSDHTSLIVLERFQDYLRYSIPPPERDLRQKYEQTIAARQSQRSAWKMKIYWHQQNFPWAESALFGTLGRAQIWKRATEKVFTKDERNRSSYLQITKWHDQALAIIAKKDEIKTTSAFVNWTKQIAELSNEGKTFSKLDPELPPADGPISISVEGLVMNPGKIRSADPLTLAQAIERAGGVSAIGSPGRVTLYRKTGRLTFNLLSKAYKPVQLQPGDMIVVRQMDPWYYSLQDGADPFGESEPEAIEDQPAIINDIEFRDSAGGATSFGGTLNINAPLSGTTVPVEQTEDTIEGLDILRTVLEINAHPLKAYLKSKGKRPRGAKFHIQAARLLFEHNQPALARQSLSNLTELNPSSSAARALALWLVEFEQWQFAEKINASLSDDVNAAIAEAAALDNARLQQRRGKRAAAATQYARLLKQSKTDTERGKFISLLLTERNALKPDALAAEPTRQKNIDADIRIVLTSDTGSVYLQVTDPLGAVVTPRHPNSLCGGRLDQAGHHQEFMMHRALPGSYKISCNPGPRSAASATVQLGIYTNWGRPDQKVEWRTVLLGKGTTNLGELKFEFPEVTEE